jgi:hypothetical protein
MSDIISLDTSINADNKISIIDRFHGRVGKVLPFEKPAKQMLTEWEKEFLIKQSVDNAIARVFKEIKDNKRAKMPKYPASYCEEVLTPGWWSSKSNISESSEE